MMTRRHSQYRSRHAAIFGALLLMTAACADGDGFTPVEPLAPAVAAVLDSLLTDEWRAGARYQQVMQRFGTVSPFREMEPVQESRAASLLQIYRSYPAFPPSRPTGAVQGIEIYASLEGACEVALEAETATVQRYARALALNPPEMVQRILRFNRANTLAFEVVAAARCR
ncbi:MAG: hypothetical protein IT361_06100 [Gemmatimonadaceae bacterium]|nr:hypothetical protein [Gemmatimonadaceae bacterium]